MPSDRIRIEYERGEAPLVWSDALWLTPDQIEAMGPEGIAGEQDARYANWLVVINTPSVEPGPEAPLEGPE